MAYSYLSTVLNSRVPNFPSPPAKQMVSFSMPNDLVANKRNYYTEIMFVDYRSGFWGIDSPMANLINENIGTVNTTVGATTGAVTGAVTGAALGATRGVGGALIGAGVGALAGGGVGASIGAFLVNTIGAMSLGSVRLPIPNSLNDIMLFNWDQREGMRELGSLIPGVAQGLTRTTSLALSAAGAMVGKTLNPLLYAAFNRPNFREFTFDWQLAPRNKKESETVKHIIRAFKAAASPAGFELVMDYPMLAIVKMYPGNLDNLAQFKPMAIKNVVVNYTPNPGGPSFFANANGTPTGASTVVTLRVTMMEIKFWRREEILIGIR